MEKILTILIIGILFFIGVRILKYFKSKQKPLTVPLKNLHFKNNLSAFQYAEKYIDNELFIAHHMSFGIVQDKSMLKDGSYHFLVQLSNSKRTVLVSGFNDKFADEINKGNLVYWGYVESVEDANNEDIEAIGHILAILNPELNINTSKWEIKKNLTH